MVYLHGRMPTQPADGTRRLGFILSNADFGRAYLADGWATRFVRDLLQHYVIVLLGYSATDPPMRYLLEGLHARGDKAPAVIYAFDNGSDEEVELRWRDRGVRALSYENADGSHAGLWNSLRAWANRADDPDAWRRTIVALAQERPGELQPHERGQVASLVKTDRGAKLFAEATPPPPAEWLCVFDRYVRYGNPVRTPGAIGEVLPLPDFSLDDDPPRSEGQPWQDGEISDDLLLSTVRPGALGRLGSFGHHQTAQLPNRLISLEHWIVRVINTPVVAWWAAGHGSLHETLLSLIEWKLNRPDEDIDDQARKVWSLILESFRNSPSEDRWFDFARVLIREGWTSSILRDFERIATPYLHCSRPIQAKPQIPPKGNWQDLRRSEVVSFEVKFPPEHAENFEVSSEALPSIVRILCRGLQHAAGLLDEIDTPYWRTATFHPEQRPGEHHVDEADRYLLRAVRFFDRLATENPALARAEVALWPRHDEFFFDKLRIYVLMKSGLFTAHECAESILALSDDGLWNRYHRRELLYTLRARWDEFSDEDRRCIEARLLQGPDQWDQEDPDEYARRKAIASATLLGWLKLQGCELSSEAEQQLPKLREADDRWRPSWDASADDSMEARGGWISVNRDASKIINAPLAEIIARAEEHTNRAFFDFTEDRPFEGLVKDRPLRALSALAIEARNGRFPTAFWRSALTDWPDDTPDRLRCLFAARLARLPREVVSDLKYYIPQWFRANLPKLAKVSVDRCWPLWDALIDHFFALGPEGNLSGVGDVSVGGKPLNRSRRTYDHSINSPIGKLAEALFDILNDQKRTQGQGIPTDIRERLERLFEAPGEGADYAVCATTIRLRWLYYVDPKWVTEKVIPFFDFDHSRSEPAWNGYLHDNELPVPELFALLKPNFLQAFSRSSTWAWDHGPINRLTEFLVVACWWNLKSHRYVTYSEARLALQQATKESREHAIWFLGNVIGNQNEWGSFGKHFVQRSWPRERKFQTSGSSRNFAHLAEEAGDDFPNVVKTILPLLGPVDHVDMLIYGGTGNSESTPLATRFPEAMLSLLDRVVPWSIAPPHDLRRIIDMIAAADPALRQDQRWRRLDGIAG
jgi:SIR2-like domain